MPEMPVDERDPRLPDDGCIARLDDILGDGLRSWVELQDMLPHPDSPISPDVSIVNSARVSFLGHSKGADQDKKLLFYLLRHRHTTPFEQVEFKFRVRAPVVVWWQWVRHRTWHYNLQSGRYTPFEEDDFYIPATWRLQSDSNKQGSAGTLEPERSQHWRDTMADLAASSFGMYEEALADGIAREQARLLLPAWGSYYIAVAKVDAWNLMHFLRLRMASDAQWEIRQYATAIFEIFKQVMPWTADAFEQYLAKEAPEE